MGMQLVMLQRHGTLERSAMNSHAESMGTILVVYLFRVTLNSSAKALRPDKLIFIAKYHDWV